MVTDDILITLASVFLMLLLMFYQFGYKDRFPYIGKNQWVERPFYKEVHIILMREVARYALGAPLTLATKNRIETTADMVLKALAAEHRSVEVNLPKLDVGVQYIDFKYTITRSEVALVMAEGDSDIK